MHKNDHATAGPSGEFLKPDPATGVPGTRLTADLANAIVDEISNVITGQGIPLVKSSNDQLAQALGQIGAVPTSGFRNLLDNGDFYFAERYRSSPGALAQNFPLLDFAGGTQFLFDRWKMDPGGSTVGEATIAHETLGEADAESLGGLFSFCDWTQDTAADGGVQPFLRQRIERVERFSNGVLRVKFRARSFSGSPTVQVQITQGFNSSTDIEILATETHAIQASWTEYASNIVIPSIVAGSMGTSFSDWIEVRLLLPAGVTFQVGLTGIMASAGSADLPWEHRHRALEADLCARYYEASQSGVRNTVSASGANMRRGRVVSSSTSLLEICERFRVRKVRTPTVVFYDDAGTADSIEIDGNQVSVSSVQDEGVDQTGYPVAGAVVSAGESVQYGWDADAEL